MLARIRHDIIIIIIIIIIIKPNYIMKVTNKFSKHIKSITNVISRGGKVCKGEVLQENAERRITSNDKCFRN